ncbi:MAG: hypothetical protein DRH08_13240 [Deltaproteobacteria bacterium]|nr:MAG: hypothetical protein DRH08_13240 [Deltaproteobacteria bacterium]
MITIEVYQVIKESNNSYTASLNFKEGDKILKRTTVNAFTKIEFKDKIRTYKEKIEQIEADKQNLLIIVQQAIDEVMGE